MLGSIIASILTMHPQVSGDRAPETLIDAVVASTTLEWEAAFAARGGAYAPPRVVLLRPDAGHPARGSGYSQPVGIVIDLGDVEAIERAFPDDGPSLNALIIAHEVGHHVQALMGDDPEVRGAARERQADCLAGWWVARADARAVRAGAVVAWPATDLETRLPKAIALLDATRSGRADGGAANAQTHGVVHLRVGAIRLGMAAEGPWTCLWGLNP